MILGALEFLAGQTVAIPNLVKGLAWLQEHAADPGLPERVEIDGKAVYALVQRYETQAAEGVIKLEAHRSYIDIQYICSGEEMMGWADVRALRDATVYNPEKDVFHGWMEAAQVTPLQVRSGQAAIFFTEDAHAPKLAVGAPTSVVKIVVKVRFE
jgi:YhcH/YjgK/YiaL family protein